MAAYGDKSIVNSSYMITGGKLYSVGSYYHAKFRQDTLNDTTGLLGIYNSPTKKVFSIELS